jgi:predicted signal transduction protein with EAL and GGDEF domain
MNFDFEKVFPEDLSRFDGPQFVRIATAVILCVMVVRSCIHLFTADGGAQRIATIDTTVEGGNNIIAIFHQWGATQLVSAVLLVVLFSRYPGFTPLILLTMALEPLMRFVASRVKAVTTIGTAPGAAFNGIAFVVVMCLFIASLKG